MSAVPTTPASTGFTPLSTTDTKLPPLSFTPPPLTASFTPLSTTNTTLKPLSVITAQKAQDAVATQKNAVAQATTDAQNLAAHKAQIAATQPVVPTQTPEQAAQAQQDSGQTPAPNNDTINSLLDGLAGSDTTGSTANGPDAQQQAVIDQDNAQIQADQEAQQKVADSIDQMANGSFPLSPAEQTQVNDVKTSYAGALAQAETYKQNITNGMIASLAGGVDKGLQTYSPQMAMGQVQSAIQAGSARVGVVNSRIVSAMSKLTDALQAADYKQANLLYTNIAKDIKLRTTEIDNINKTVADATTKLLDYNLKVTQDFQKNQNTILTDAAKAGAPPEVISAIGSATDIAGAVAAAGNYLQGGTGLVGEYALYQRQAKALGQNPLSFLDFATKMANLKAPKPSASSSLDLSSNNPAAQTTPTTQNWIAEFYSNGGNIPSPYGKTTAGSPFNIAFNNIIANNAMKLGLSGAQMAAVFNGKQSAEKALTTVTKNQGMMTVAEETARQNFQQVLDKMASLPPKTLSPLLNQFVQTGAIQTGDPNVKPFAALLTTSLNEYAKVITGQTSGAAVSDAARKEAQSMIDAADTPETFQNFVATAIQEMGNRASGYDAAKQSLYGIITDRFGDVSSPSVDANNPSPVDQLLSSQPSNDKVVQSLADYSAKGPEYAAYIANLRKQNPGASPYQIYQLAGGK